MSGAWLNFIIVILIQFLLFIIHAYYEKKLSDMSRILGRGILIGVVVGLLSDIVLGKFFGLWSYTFGFGALPLTLSAAFVYGLFSAHTLLMQRAKLAHFFIWIMVVGIVYEVSNYFFHVWRYEFALLPLGFLIFLIVGNFGTAVVIAAISHIFLGQRFSLLDKFLKR